MTFFFSPNPHTYICNLVHFIYRLTIFLRVSSYSEKQSQFTVSHKKVFGIISDQPVDSEALQKGNLGQGLWTMLWQRWSQHCLASVPSLIGSWTSNLTAKNHVTNHLIATVNLLLICAAGWTDKKKAQYSLWFEFIHHHHHHSFIFFR